MNPPVYSQVAYDIAAKIASGEIKQGERFTGRSLMGSQYAVSSETIRRALKLLSDMGIVSIQQNVGSMALSPQRAAEYVEQYKAGKDLRTLKSELRELIARRDALNGQIVDTIDLITDLSERFRRSDLLRTYEFAISETSRVIGQTIGGLQFRQKTGATIVAIRHGEEISLSPGPQAVLEPNDVLVVACDIASIGLVSELINPCSSARR